MRKGIHTTEFWIAAAAQLAVFLNLVGAWDWASNWHGGILATISGAVYAISRGIAKHGATNGSDAPDA